MGAYKFENDPNENHLNIYLFEKKLFFVIFKINSLIKKFIPENEESCQYHSASFSPGYEYFILECLGPSIPTVSLYKTQSPLPRFISLLQNNTALRVRQK